MSQSGRAVLRRSRSTEKHRSHTEGPVKICNNNAIVSNNSISAGVTLPLLVSASVAASHYFSGNIFYGSPPTSYYRKSGDGTARSLNNRVVDGTPVLLGAIDETYHYRITTTGIGSPAVHTIQFHMPTEGVHLISVWSIVAGAIATTAYSQRTFFRTGKARSTTQMAFRSSAARSCLPALRWLLRPR